MKHVEYVQLHHRGESRRSHYMRVMMRQVLRDKRLGKLGRVWLRLSYSGLA